jgi:epoxyqueuosine reductase QueG/putative sterol carrier protein
MMSIMQSRSTEEGDDARAPRALAAHPTAIAARARPAPPAPGAVTLEEVRALAIAAGADDAGAVPLDHPDLADEVAHVRRALPGAQTLVAIVVRMHPDDVQSPQRSVANHEFHHTGDQVDEVARRIAVALAARGHQAINPAMAFPMEMTEFPGRTWIVSHKRVAVAAQLGRMGLHRSVIHPTFGSFVLLGTVITSAPLVGAAPALTFDPCVSCKLCVAACPVGAIEPGGAFRFSACYDHNYREFMTGFTDFVEEIADSKDRHALRARVSLAYRPNYKAAYCIAVCPAGEDIIGRFLRDRAGHLRATVKPLTDKVEPVYVVAGSDAQAHVAKRFPHKQARVVRSSLRPASAPAFFRAIPLTFQRGPAAGWKATFHFDLHDPAIQMTVRIDDGQLAIEDGLVGVPDVRVAAAAQVWLEIVTKQRNPVLAVLTRRLNVSGDRALLAKFAACFPR